MNIFGVLKYINKSQHEHFIYVDYKIYKRWWFLINIFVYFNKKYKPVSIFRKNYKYLNNIVVVGLRYYGKNVKRRTTGIAKEFLKENSDPMCIYCECKLDPSNATTDHIVPISDGGNNSKVNLVLSCYDCNNERGSTPFKFYLKSKNLKYKKEKVIFI